MGYTDSVYCGFEGSGVSGCPWQLEEGSETRAEDAGLPLPSVDASGSTQGMRMSFHRLQNVCVCLCIILSLYKYSHSFHFSGHYVYLSSDMDSSETEVVMSYTAASYACGYSFYYQLYGDVELSLLTTMGEEVWTSKGHGTDEWTYISTSQLDYLADTLDDGLQFVLVTNSSGGHVALDAVGLQFCLPCDLEPLQDEGTYM